MEQMKLNTDERSVLVTHQFVTGAKRSESEDISVGGTDNVDASVFDEFDYVRSDIYMDHRRLEERRYVTVEPL